ncbi:MAG: hypothetical protein HGA45_31730 [Chloroflexales bacterium]|nr:hypothetical protein [Chloroflexales bacterium]
MEDELVTRSARLRLEEDGIVRATVLPGVAQSLAEAQENFAAQIRLTQGQRHALLVDIRAGQSQDREAREFYTRSEAARVIRAVAILVESPMSRLIGNFFLGFNKPTIPLRLFSSDEEALGWLREIRD